MEAPSCQDTFSVDYVSNLIRSADTAPSIDKKYADISAIFTYILRFPDIATKQPEIAHAIRQKCKSVEGVMSNLIANETISFDMGSQLVQLASQVLHMTDEIAAFDCDEVTHVIPTRLRTATPTITSYYSGDEYDSDSDSD